MLYVHSFFSDPPESKFEHVIYDAFLKNCEIFFVIYCSCDSENNSATLLTRYHAYAIEISVLAVLLRYAITNILVFFIVSLISIIILVIVYLVKNMEQFITDTIDNIKDFFSRHKELKFFTGVISIIGTLLILHKININFPNLLDNKQLGKEEEDESEERRRKEKEEESKRNDDNVNNMISITEFFSKYKIQISLVCLLFSIFENFLITCVISFFISFCLFIIYSIAQVILDVIL